MTLFEKATGDGETEVGTEGVNNERTSNIRNLELAQQNPSVELKEARYCHANFAYFVEDNLQNNHDQELNGRGDTKNSTEGDQNCTS